MDRAKQNVWKRENGVFWHTDTTFEIHCLVAIVIKHILYWTDDTSVETKHYYLIPLKYP